MSQTRDELSKSRKVPGIRQTEKIFVVRESYYTTLLEDVNIKSVYHIFVAAFIFVLLDSVSHDLLTYGRVYLGLRTIKAGFAGFHIAFGVWLLMHIPMLGLYYALQTWHKVKRNLKDPLQSLWNYGCVIGFAGFQLTILYIGTVTCLARNLQFAPTIALLMETIRLMMKAYAFVRTNAAKLLTEDSTFKDKSIELAPISSYLYFLFAPTFLYRDFYPRRTQIRWGFAIKHLLTIIAYIFIISFIYERYVLPTFEDFGERMPTNIEVLDKFFVMVLPATLVVFSTGYMLLHCWLNLTSELLLFGDRVFYKEWWTAANYETYYRLWNIVVHDWFYEYIYKDCYKYLFKGSKVCSSMVVFFMSALMHEFVIMVTLRMFYPVLIFLFGGLGVVMFHATKKFPHTAGKMFFWFTFLFGNTFIYSLYPMEYFARKNSSWLSGEGWMEELTRTPASWRFIGLTEA